jgi:hypothetical protein
MPVLFMFSALGAAVALALPPVYRLLSPARVMR